MIRALIFDFNGILADDDPIHMKAFRRVAEEEGLSFTDEEYMERYLPLNDWDCFRTLHESRRRPLDAALCDDLIRRKGVYYFEAIAGTPVLFDGAADAIRAAAGQCSVAIASGARREEIVHILSQSHLESYFSVIVAAEDVIHGKPHPEPFVRAWELLRRNDSSLELSECVAIEDSIGGIESAHGAGMRCLGVAHSYSERHLQDSRADWVLGSIKEFPAWLELEVSK